MVWSRPICQKKDIIFRDLVDIFQERSHYYIAVIFYKLQFKISNFWEYLMVFLSKGNVRKKHFFVRM